METFMDTQPRTAAESVPTHLIGSRPALSAQPRFQRPEARSGPQRTPVAVPPVLFTGRIDDSTGEPEAFLRPAAPVQPDRTPYGTLRISGPGRKERAYQERLESLEVEAEALRAHRVQAEIELEVARRVERGTSRFVDRLEAQVTEAQEQTEVVRQQKSRLLIALGAELRESERLREALVDARSQLARIAAKPEPEPVPRGFWARLTGTSRARSER
tara:strand:+ start:5821 stop:6468 length:648 start_codon:yes stop_codon:yes gene_type:complete